MRFAKGEDLKPKIEVKIDSVMKDLGNIKLSGSDLATIGVAASTIVKNAQKNSVPVKTGATKESIGFHIVEKSEKKFENDIGPETEYAPYIEYGTSNPNYPMQPFVRPSGRGENLKRVYQTVNNAIKQILVKRWK